MSEQSNAANTCDVSEQGKMPQSSSENWDCPKCHDMGFIWHKSLPDYPDGAWTVCVCQRERVKRSRARKLMEMSGLTEGALSRWTFDTFSAGLAQVASAKDREEMVRIKKLVMAYAEEPRGWLVLMGGYGAGKSHLAYAVAARRVQLGHAVYAANVPDLLDMLRDGYKEDQSQVSERLDTIRKTSLLVLDDLGTENATPWATEKLTQVIDYRYREELPMIVTTNIDLYHPEGRISQRITSRLLDGAESDKPWCQYVVVPAGDYRRSRVVES